MTTLERPRLRSEWPVVAAVLLLMTSIAVESLAVTTVMPVVAADIGALGWFSLAMAATVTTGLVGTVVGGAWADRSGPSSALAVGGLLFVAGVALCVVAPDMTTFLAGRLLQGFGGGIDAVAIYVVIAAALPEALRPRMFGLLTTAWLLPSIVGPLAVGALAERAGWRTVFGVVAVVAAVSLAVLLVVTRGMPARPGPADPTVARRAWLAGLAGSAILGLHLAAHVSAPLSFAVTAVALGLLVAAARRLLPRGTLSARPGAPRLIALRGSLGATVVAAEAYLPLHLQVDRQYSPAQAGLAVALGALGWVSGAWLQGRLGVGRDEDATAIRWATRLLPVGPVTILLLVAGLVPVAVAVAGGVVTGAAMGMAYPRITSAVLALAPPDRRGDHSSALQAAEGMSGSAFLAITGAILAVLTGPAALVTVYGVVVVAAIGAAVLGRRPPTASAAEGPERPLTSGATASSTSGHTVRDHGDPSGKDTTMSAPTVQQRQQRRAR